ncbi:MAG: VapC toxin family PIN domain ribonuclease [Deltaproteobacteria bacterium]|nr:MAG: VapC toxin family PIN domain ribonuclease [Deltaproteobacteria bacterium]RLC15940.1 MAG: VapC toxin family PIN domain ribonuclease [Deltaproteobacteria bacterium]RLE04030.1 MAG: VapC toxin family PIN domain ribonuclease [Bacteroidota bacterium]
MIVVDTNVISYFYLNSDYSSLAVQIFKKDPVWSAPLLWRSEFRNVLTFYTKKNILSLAEAIEIFESAEELLKENEYEINSVQVLKLSYSSGCSAYDCEFVILAKDLSVTLVTEDKKVLTNFPESAVSMQKFLEIHSKI